MLKIGVKVKFNPETTSDSLKRKTGKVIGGRYALNLVEIEEEFTGWFEDHDLIMEEKDETSHRSYT
jgi:hypothetical protein